jgi:hypothetical protein
MQAVDIIHGTETTETRSQTDLLPVRRDDLGDLGVARRDAALVRLGVRAGPRSAVSTPGSGGERT